MMYFVECGSFDCLILCLFCGVLEDVLELTTKGENARYY